MMRKVMEQRVRLVRLTEPHQVHRDCPVTGRYSVYEASTHIGPGWIAMNHYDRQAPVAFVYIVDSETVDLEPTLLKRPTLKVRPPLPDHLVRCPRTLMMKCIGPPSLKRYRSVVTPKETIIFRCSTIGNQDRPLD